MSDTDTRDRLAAALTASLVKHEARFFSKVPEEPMTDIEEIVNEVLAAIPTATEPPALDVDEVRDAIQDLENVMRFLARLAEQDRSGIAPDR